ncbi:nad-dependent epimerase dehydratase [Colletotrichum karsti]|uniref:Nad-dependent epimerase dehydratase n=1 Tax=Colletotrichum karsti TaxID=1095194 RepID=A0A9P6I476_9PEZI|nr:nad-dependent epimerase dehydratase [Colletotrichum karsti]KAF9875929.1 nad-dependent epimerase dehydratase [Colletotrichum karsti]
MPPRTLKVGVIGPKGQAGSCVVDELLSRGHSVVGISRNPPDQWPSPGKGIWSSTSVDIHKEHTKLISIISSGFDAIVCAYGPSLKVITNVYAEAIEGHGRIKTALLASTHDGPFIIIGGAGSIHVSNRLQLTDEDGFAFSWWWTWPDEHLDYMTARGFDHGSLFISLLAMLLKWSRSHIQRPTFYSWILSPFVYAALAWVKSALTNRHNLGLITGSRMAFTMWNGVKDKSWSFLSPPGLLRDKGVRTGEYKVFVDSPEDPAVEAANGGIYNEDMAVAVVDEVENNKLAYQHWSCTGPIGLREW